MKYALHIFSALISIFIGFLDERLIAYAASC